MSGDPHLIWVTSRAAGITAMVLASSSVSVGLLMALRKNRGGEWRKTHEWLSLLTLAAIALHAGALLLDPWLSPGLGGVLVPFVSPYRPLATALGIIAAYGLIALGLSYYARSRIGPARWRRWHRWTAAFWVAGVAHGLLGGTDASRTWMLALTALAVAPGALLLIARPLSAPSRRAGAPQVPCEPRPSAGS